MSGGRGSRRKGEEKKIPRIQRSNPEEQHHASAGASSSSASTSTTVHHLEPSSTTSTGESEKTIRPRGRVAQAVNLIPTGITALKVAGSDNDRRVEVVSNFVKITPMTSGPVFQYRIEFEPEIDSIRLKKRLFEAYVRPKFSQQKVMFDGSSDIRSASGAHEELNIVANHPVDTNAKINITLKKVGIVSNQYENLRLYNMNMKDILSKLGFFRISRDGRYVHPNLEESIGTNNQIYTVKGWKTSANVHEGSVIMMNLEAIHKIMQRRSVLDMLNSIREESRRRIGANLPRDMDEALANKLVITKYNNHIYRIERVRIDLSPHGSTFKDAKSGEVINFVDYFRRRYDVEIKVRDQPLLECLPNSLRKGEDKEGRECILVPELCNLAGLTNEQQNNFSIKRELIEKSQIPPQERVKQVTAFLNQLHQNADVQRSLEQWGHTYEKELVTIRARTLPVQRVGTGAVVNNKPESWPTVQARTGGFEAEIQKSKVARKPEFRKLVVLISPEDFASKNELQRQIESGFKRIGCEPDKIEYIEVINEHKNAISTPGDFLRALRQIPQSTTATIIVFPRQLRKHYDAVKHFASVQAGMITQVLISKLLKDQRKATSVALKIGIQVIAKIGGDPWYINLPYSDLMICGYDTYHDTAKGSGSRSFGAFIASINAKFSRWFSKADVHDRHDELSAHIQENVKLALKQWQKMNGKFPKSIIMYRDGVGDGQLEHVFTNEIKELKKAIASVNKGIKLTYICVNKRIGARFYLKTSAGGKLNFDNPTPGTVIDDVVTRPTRYDFYLISQSTSRGTVTPTYYSILHDESGMKAADHQLMAFKLCFLYYNWTGTVRVPAPCQYAHKLALLCGEHLHAVPNSVLDDKLHFL